MKNNDFHWTDDQKQALEALKGYQNVFLTGGAGTGKSTVISAFLKEMPAIRRVATLATTGTAAIMIGGRTVHSFFGLGILEGGREVAVDRALKHRGIVERLKKTDVILIDEISMLGLPEFEAAEEIARRVRKIPTPWGGIQMIFVGDFSQLPPVVKGRVAERPWCFLSPVWKASDLNIVVLREVVRSPFEDWNRTLDEVRHAEVSEKSLETLRRKESFVDLEFPGTRLFARRDSAELLNQEQLHRLSGEVQEFRTKYEGDARKIEDLKRNAPIPEVLYLKQGARVMFRQNDPEYRFVNGTLGVIQSFDDEGGIWVKKLNGDQIAVYPATFSVLDGEGEVVAKATNYPLNLSWACTIHKAQGATLDLVHADLTGVWEHGQAYVALSRVRDPKHLTVQGLAPQIFRVDPTVVRFYQNLGKS